MLKCPAMKATILLLGILLCFSSCKSRKERLITVAFNGWHGRSFLKQGCTSLQNEYDHIRQLPLKEQAIIFARSDNNHLPCLFPPVQMNLTVENQLLSAFASNPRCEGVKFLQGYYDPSDSAKEVGQIYLSSDWRLSLDLTPSAETGEVSLKDSQWTLNPKSLSGALTSLEKASTDICVIVKRQGGQV
jgi:hypothetical protein